MLAVEGKVVFKKCAHPGAANHIRFSVARGDSDGQMVIYSINGQSL